MQDAIEQDEQEQQLAKTEPANEKTDGAPASGDSGVPCPFPPDEVANGKDIRNLYGLCWLAKS